MLRFGLVLLVASSALAAPSDYYETVELDLLETNEVASNIGCSNHITDGLFSMRDGAESNMLMITIEKIINDLASQQCVYSQGLGISQALAHTLGISTGIPGDACQCASFINAFTSGNYHHELKGFINHIAQLLDRLVHLKQNPLSARYSVGPQTGCSGGGRSYNFEPAWNAIIANASPAAANYVQEEYCTARRLYNGFDLRNNIQAAAITSFSLPPVASIMSQCRVPLSNFVSVLLGNRNPSSALGAAKQCLLQSV